jgi:hypothetical protein
VTVQRPSWAFGARGSPTVLKVPSILSPFARPAKVVVSTQLQSGAW